MNQSLNTWIVDCTHCDAVVTWEAIHPILTQERRQALHNTVGLTVAVVAEQLRSAYMRNFVCVRVHDTHNRVPTSVRVCQRKEWGGVSTWKWCTTEENRVDALCSHAEWACSVLNAKKVIIICAGESLFKNNRASRCTGHTTSLMMAAVECFLPLAAPHFLSHHTYRLPLPSPTPSPPP